MSEISQRFAAWVGSERRDCLAVLGAIAAFYLTVLGVRALWRGFREFVLARALGFGVDFKSFGAWAVVTGSTDGIGRAYAEALARAGLNIVLVSRSAEKLNNTAKEIEAKYGVQTKVVAVDFTGGAEIYSRLAHELQGIDIAVLVNNVGMSYEFPMFLTEVPDKLLLDIINVNCNAVTMLTKLVLPGMVEKKKGVVINISSLSGVRETPLLSVYSATKAYVQFFSRCIDDEYKSKGIIVQNVSPGFVVSKLSGIRSASLIAPTPSSFVGAALPTVGRVRATCGCAVHALQCYFTDLLPDRLYFKLTRSVLAPVRARGMKKREKKQ